VQFAGVSLTANRWGQAAQAQYGADGGLAGACDSSVTEGDLVMSLRFDEAKATQAAAYFLDLRGGRMHSIKLIKLLYLADREALLRWGQIFTTDHHVSMPNGPVTSKILNLVTDDRSKPYWSQYISAPLGDYEVELLKKAPTDRLSRAEEKLMQELFKQYGHRNRWDLIDNVMHKLPEWRDPNGSSIPISTRDILEAGGENEEEIRAVIREVHATARDEDNRVACRSEFVRTEIEMGAPRLDVETWD
jgi:uncharacterized phage-associated protein